MRLLVAIAMAIAAFAAAAPASAQRYSIPIIIYTPGHSRNGLANPACLKGKLRPVSDIAAARASSGRVFAHYLRAAGALAPADVSADFATRGQRDIDRYPLGIDDIRAANDSLARAYAAAGGDPAAAADAFVVAGGRPTALGRWVLRDPAGAVLGYYRVRFGGKRDKWKILTVERFTGPDTVPTVPQYCYEPGDLYGPGHAMEPMIDPPGLPRVAHPSAYVLGDKMAKRRRIIAKSQIK
jgi:hypothetical protein